VAGSEVAGDEVAGGCAREAGKRRLQGRGRPRRRHDVEWRRLPDRLLVFAPATGALHTLNPVAGELFLLCDGRRSPAELARRLAARHRVTAGVARGWVGGGLAALDEAELLAAGGARNGR